MAGVGLLALLGRSAATSSASVLARCAPATVASGPHALDQATKRFFAAADDAFARKDVVYHIADTDPEALAGVKAYQRALFAAAAKGPLPPPPAEPTLELTAKVERKYKAAEIVESGIQNIAVPLSYDSDASVKRYASQLAQLGEQAGFADAAVELEARLAEIASTAGAVKDFLLKSQPLATPEFHAALLDAVTAVEGETGGAVTFDPTSAGYKKFAERVKALAQARKLPWQMLLSHKTKLAGADEAAADALTKDYTSWRQGAAVADAKAEIEDLRAEAARLLDAHLSKTAEQVRKEQDAALAALQRKLDAAKSAQWAAKYKEDLEYVKWFDARVAADPLGGPRAA